MLCAPHQTGETPFPRVLKFLLPSSCCELNLCPPQVSPGFLLVFHCGLALSEAQQNSCPACIPHNIKFSIPVMHRSHSISRLLGGSLGVSFREIFSPFSACMPSLKSGLQLKEREERGETCDGPGEIPLYPHARMAPVPLQGDSTACLWHQLGQPRPWHGRESWQRILGVSMGTRLRSSAGEMRLRASRVMG